MNGTRKLQHATDPEAGDVACLSTYQRKLQRVRQRRENRFHAPAHLHLPTGRARTSDQKRPLHTTANDQSKLVMSDNMLCT